MDNLILDNTISSDIEQSLSNIMKNISKEESVLCELLILQEKILLDTKGLAPDVDNYILINDSINCLIKNIINLKMLTQLELESVQKLIDKINVLNEDEELEE